MVWASVDWLFAAVLTDVNWTLHAVSVVRIHSQFLRIFESSILSGHSETPICFEIFHKPASSVVATIPIESNRHDHAHPIRSRVQLGRIIGRFLECFGVHRFTLPAIQLCCDNWSPV